MNGFFKILGFVFALLFAWAAYLQNNDTDAMRWYAIYGMAALASLLFAMGQLRFVWAVFLAVFYMGFAIYVWPEEFEGVTVGEGDIINIERGREALGLLIASFVMLIYLLRIGFNPKSKV